MDENKRTFSRSEKITIVLLLILLIGGVALYLTDFPIGKILFGLTSSSGTEVGKLDNSTGQVRREQEAESSFNDIPVETTLYNHDTVVTAPTAGATLSLNDGSTIDMAPGTLIHLDFEDSFSLSGVVRSVNVNVISGSVKGKNTNAKNKIVIKSATGNAELTRDNPIASVAAPVRTSPPALVAPSPVPSSAPIPSESLPPPTLPSKTPSPSPSPSKILPSPPVKRKEVELISPKSGAVLQVPNGSATAEVSAQFEWKISPAPAQVQFELTRLDAPAVSVFKKRINPPQGGRGSLPLALKVPGNYRWTLRDSLDTSIVYGGSKFSVNSHFKGIAVLDPTVSGEKRSSSILEDKLLKKFDIQLAWQPYPNASHYKLDFFVDANDTKPALEKNISSTSYQMNENKVFSGKVFYEVSTQTSAGFIVQSDRQPFIFEFIPPIPTLPRNQAQISLKDLKSKDNNLLFTWQKTNFTQQYELSISIHPQFATTLVKLRSPENFFVLKTPKPGTYYWKVESLSGKLKSGPSNVAKVTVTP